RRHRRSSTGGTVRSCATPTVASSIWGTSAPCARKGEVEFQSEEGMPTYRFKQVDAFTSRAFFGNPVAVVMEADALESEEMQRIPAGPNPSETTSVLHPTVAHPAYRLRIFSPGRELPFAGHPTIGSCHAVLEAQMVAPEGGRLVQECGA